MPRKIIMNFFTLALVIAVTFSFAPKTAADNAGAVSSKLSVTVSGGGAVAYTPETEIIFILTSGDITIEGDGTPVTDRIVILSNGNDADITLKNVYIDVSQKNNCALEIERDYGTNMDNITVFLEGNNTLISGGEFAGIQKNSDDTTGILTITGSGSLTAAGGNGAAGIGGGKGESSYNIVISGGIINAVGSGGAPGIGGGVGGCANTDIKGGSVSGTVQSGDWQVLLSQGNATITNYSGTDEAIAVSDDFWNYPVVAIGENAFANNIFIKNITIPDSVTSIGNNAFLGCMGTKIIYGGFVYEVTDSTVSIIGCTLSGSVIIPDYLGGLPVLSIGTEAFSGNTGITEIIIPDGVTYIGDNAFSNCTGLRDIYIPDSVSYIGDDAFSGCSDVTIHCNEYSAADEYLKNNPDLKGDITHIHKIDISWSNDEEYHWHGCKCGLRNDEANHSFDDGTVIKSPSHTEYGEKTFVCTVCGYSFTTQIPILEHSFDEEWTFDSTSHWHECSCGEKIDIAQHISNDGIVTVQPTAITDGKKEYSCIVCKCVIRTETIAATESYTYSEHPSSTEVSIDPFICNTASFTENIDVSAKTNNDTVTLNWNKIKKSDKYIVYMYKNGKYVKIKTTSENSAVVKKLKNEETYKFIIRYTIDGKLSPTAYSGKTEIKVYYKPVPKPTAEKYSIKLTWEPVPDATKYAVYKYADGKAVKLIETKKLSVKIGKLLPDTEYKYIVRTYVDGKWSAMLKSDIVSVRTEAE